MKTFALALFFWMLLLTAPSAVRAKPTTEGFLIDPSKHYVYLKFDHVGDRKPLSPEEPSKGLWLRLVNNCRIPIIVAIFNTGTADPGIGVFDQVVSVAVKGPVLHFGGLAEGGAKSAGPPQGGAPQGYSPPDVFSTTTVAPGESLLFSVPLNHVGPSWGMQVRFYLDFPGHFYGTGPYTIVSFDWQDIPEKFRGAEPVSVSPEPATH